MTPATFKHLYGPVYSWRIGMSLGIDPLAVNTKYCNFACSYCQLGVASEYGVERRIFVSPSELMAEIKDLPEECQFDYFTFSGNGEPTLAANLGDLIKAVRMTRPARVAVITNAALIMRKNVQADLSLADLVLMKLDAADENFFQCVNAPEQGVVFSQVIAGIKEFRRIYKGKLALQLMFVETNKAQADRLACIAQEIGADEVQLNTPLRPSSVKPLSEIEMAEIKKVFMANFGTGVACVRSVYEEEKREYKPFNAEATKKRHGD